MPPIAAPSLSPRSAPLSRWRVFSAAPHRMMFFAGMSQMLLVMAWWAIELAGRYRGTPWLVATVPAIHLHAVLLLYGTFPFFIFGFLLTVYPRWLDAAPIPRRHYVPPFLALATGVVLIYAGVLAGRPLLIAGLGALLAGWALVLAALFRVYRRAARRGLHERALNLALVAGAAGLVLYLAAAVFEAPTLYAAGREVGLWMFLIPVVFAVAHRMIPFFSSNVLEHYRMVRPPWSLPVMVALAFGHAVLELAGLAAWRFLVDAPMLALVLYHTIAWGFFRSFRIRLLAMLHIAFLWLSIALALYAAQSALLATTGTNWLGRAPVHALGIGFLAGIVLAMASRVTLGHSGRPLLATGVVWYAFLAINAVAVVRLSAEIVPTAAATLNLAAALLWLAAVGVWAGHFLPMYLRPRADGQPG